MLVLHKTWMSVFDWLEIQMENYCGAVGIVNPISTTYTPTFSSIEFAGGHHLTCLSSLQPLFVAGFHCVAAQADHHDLRKVGLVVGVEWPLQAGWKCDIEENNLLPPEQLWIWVSNHPKLFGYRSGVALAQSD